MLELQAFHGRQEVMASDHVETHLQPIASIMSKCNIHTLEQYMVSHVMSWLSRSQTEPALMSQLRCLVACKLTFEALLLFTALSSSIMTVK